MLGFDFILMLWELLMLVIRDLVAWFIYLFLCFAVLFMSVFLFFSFGFAILVLVIFVILCFMLEFVSKTMNING